MGQHGRQVKQGQGLGLFVAAAPRAAGAGLVALQLGKIALRVRAFFARVGGGDAGRHIHGVKDHQTAEGDHQIERQHQHARDIVGVQPGALPALARAEGEKVLEDAAVRDDAGQQGNEHQQRGRAHHPAALNSPTAFVGSAQLKVKAVEKFAATCFSRLKHRTGLRMQEQGLKAAIGLIPPQQVDSWRALIGQAHDEVTHARRMLVQRDLGALRDFAVGRWQAVQLGPHPEIEFVLEKAQRAGDENCKQNPAQNQPGPGMQPGHGLAKTFLLWRGRVLGLCFVGGRHAAIPHHGGPYTAAPRARAGSSTPAQASQAVRAKKVQPIAMA